MTSNKIKNINVVLQRGNNIVTRNIKTVRKDYIVVLHCHPQTILNTKLTKIK